MVRGGVGNVPAGSCLIHVRADGGEGGGEIVEGLVECDARVFDGDGDEFHPSPVFSESRDEGGVFLCSFHDFVVATKVST